MGTDNLFHIRKNREVRRKSQNRDDLSITFLIVCEGERTEPNYFKSFKLDSVQVDVQGTGFNTLSLVKKTVKIKNKALTCNEPYNRVWCVFDKDSFSLQNFNAAIRLAKKEGIKVAYSNEAFELWYLLHFNYYDTAFSRTRYKKMLSKLLGQPYKKNSKTMYSELRERQPNAIRNAKKLLKTFNPNTPGENNPSTTVHKLVEELNKYLRK